MTKIADARKGGKIGLFPPMLGTALCQHIDYRAVFWGDIRFKPTVRQLTRPMAHFQLILAGDARLGDGTLGLCTHAFKALTGHNMAKDLQLGIIGHTAGRTAAGQANDAHASLAHMGIGRQRKRFKFQGDFSGVGNGIYTVLRTGGMAGATVQANGVIISATSAVANSGGGFPRKCARRLGHQDDVGALHFVILQQKQRAKAERPLLIGHQRIADLTAKGGSVFEIFEHRHNDGATAFHVKCAKAVKPVALYSRGERIVSPAGAYIDRVEVAI